ncbi:hypothetical protein ACIOKD_14415 [Streptomyces sp. NPDC087844]|uniref:hypothetical protein n=1 Tax=Streptomyces sp. NPDC087844 TaxID=3365805 RepID=UPI00382D347A
MMPAGPVPGELYVGAAIIGAAYLASLAALLLFAVVVAFVRWRRARQHDVGADALRLLQTLDLSLDRLSTDNPELAEGFARLDAAVREDQERGQQL